MTKKAQLDPTYIACESERVEQVRKESVSEMSEARRGKEKVQKEV